MGNLSTAAKIFLIVQMVLQMVSGEFGEEYHGL